MSDVIILMFLLHMSLIIIP